MHNKNVSDKYQFFGVICTTLRRFPVKRHLYIIIEIKPLSYNDPLRRSD